tara:strand:+ start:2307 stop:2483 length:177 start_codon:yes stop_codon:yes gene_type:complete
MNEYGHSITIKLFKSKPEIEKLHSKYKDLMKEWHKLSSINRAENDKKICRGTSYYKSN